ncbi:unnamed protein product, partial [Ectocarpus sp. 12 AP-2014]
QSTQHGAKPDRSVGVQGSTILVDLSDDDHSSTGLRQTLPSDFTLHEKEASLWSGPPSMLRAQQESKGAGYIATKRTSY